MTKKIDLNDLRTDDIFSEESHYIFKGKNGVNYEFLHLESKNTVTLTGDYVESLLSPANQYHQEFEVGKEDKFWTAKQIEELAKTKTGELPRVGDLKQRGIKSIWNDIHSGKVFYAKYLKNPKALTKKELAEKREAQFNEAYALLEKAKKNKKNTVDAAKVAITLVQENPILPVNEGEVRELYGYKVQFSSINGSYDVIDMKIPTTENQKRQLNVNTLQELIFDGVRYIVK